MKYLRYIAKVRLLTFSFTVLVVIAGIVASAITFAVNNNNPNISQDFIDKMAGWNQDNIGDEQCGSGFNHDDHTWVSELNSPRDGTINVGPNQTTANMWFNYAPAHSDSIIGTGPNYLITDKTLKQSQSNVTNATANLGMTVSGLTGA